MKIMTCLLDSSAWLAVLDPADPNHEIAKEYLSQLIEKDAKLVSNNIIIDHTLQSLKEKRGSEIARKFLNIVDESILTVNLRMDWLSRRVRRMAVHKFISSGEKLLNLKYFYIQETLKRKKVDIIFSFDPQLKRFGLPMMPQKKSEL